MSDTKKTNLNKIMSWDGKTYGPGVADLPVKAAEYAEKRGFGNIAGSADGGDGYKPLPFEETFQRFEKGDASPEVFESLKHYQPIIAEANKTGKNPTDLIAEREAAEKANSQNESENSKPAGENSGEPTGLPKDFPNRAAFMRLGFTSVQQVQAKSRDELIAMNGVAEKSADEALAYGKK